MNKKEIENLINTATKELKQLFEEYQNNPIDYINQFCYKYLYGLDAVRTLKRFNKNVKEKIESDKELHSNLNLLLQINKLDKDEILDRIFYPIDNIYVGIRNFKLQTNDYLYYDSYNGRYTYNKIDPNSFSYSTSIDIGNFSKYNPHYLASNDILHKITLFSGSFVNFENVKFINLNNQTIEYQTLRISLNNSFSHFRFRNIIIQYDPSNYRSKFSLITNNMYVPDCVALSYANMDINTDNIVIITDSPIFSNEFISYMNKLKRVLHNDSELQINPLNQNESDLYLRYSQDIHSKIHKTLYMHQLIFKEVVDILDVYYNTDNIVNKPLLLIVKDNYIHQYNTNHDNRSSDENSMISDIIRSCDFSNLDICVDYYIDKLRDIIKNRVKNVE